ncbi:MAG: hypothetical protein U0165_19155 [Polyangiaceae bacterium]
MLAFVKHIREILRLLWKLVRQYLMIWLGKIIRGFLLKALLYVSIVVGVVAALVVLIKVLM